MTAEPARSPSPGRPGSLAPPQGLSARAWQGPGGAQCTPERAERTVGVRAPGALADNAFAGPGGLPAAGDRGRQAGRPA